MAKDRFLRVETERELGEIGGGHPRQVQCAVTAEMLEVVHARRCYRCPETVRTCRSESRNDIAGTSPRLPAQAVRQFDCAAAGNGIGPRGRRGSEWLKGHGAWLLTREGHLPTPIYPASASCRPPGADGGVGMAVGDSAKHRQWR
jgi:hypothetical protein